MVLQDISRTVAYCSPKTTCATPSRASGWPTGRERDLSWLEYSVLTPGEPSPDGSEFVFSEETETNGPDYAACIRKFDGSPPVRLGEGLPTSLSPDGSWVMAVRPRFARAPAVADRRRRKTKARAPWAGAELGKVVSRRKADPHLGKPAPAARSGPTSNRPTAEFREPSRLRASSRS